MYIKTQVPLCVNAYSHRCADWIAYTHICWLCTQKSQTTWICILSEYTAIHADGTYCKAHRHLNTPSIACDRCCQEESTFIPFLSFFFFGMPISVHSVAMSQKRFPFLFQFLCERFLFSFFLSPVLSSWNWSRLCQERLEEDRGKRGRH